MAGGAGRPIGSSDKDTRERRQTSEQLQLQVARTQATKKKNAAKKSETKLKDSHNRLRANNAAVPHFFRNHPKPSTNPGQGDVSGSEAAETVTTGDDPPVPTNTVVESINDSAANNDCLAADATGTGEEGNDPVEEDVAVYVTIDNPLITGGGQPVVIAANLDFDEDEARKTTARDADEYPGGNVSGVQQKFVEAVQKRLKFEVSKNGKATKNTWLLDHLRLNGWWLRKLHGRWAARKLGIKKEYEAYYRDIFVWLPDIMWEDKVNKTMMPCCPNCKTNSKVGPHCFRDNHFGRVIVGMDETYFCISRRYICRECKTVAQRAKKQVEQLAQANHIIADVGEVDEERYTFMAWNNDVLPLYPYGRGEKFPAVLTWRAGLDKKVVRNMRPLYDGGFRPLAHSKLLLEMHTEKFVDECLSHENETKAQRESELGKTMATGTRDPLGDFGDERKYCGLVPTGEYLEHAYKVYHASIRTYLNKEVKKRGADRLHWDVSYKEAKHLCQFRGRPVFKGLVTALNALGEVRMQFHVYTDSHEQMMAALEAFKGTLTNLGLPGVKLFVTDNPVGDEKFFKESLPSLQEQQQIFDEALSSGSAPPILQNSDEFSYDYSKLLVTVVAETTEIERVINAMMDDVNKSKMIGLDAEWNILRASAGFQTGQSKVMTIQIAYRNSEGAIQVIIVRTEKLVSLPLPLINLLCNDSIIISGNKVSADLKKIGKDFNIIRIKSLDQLTRSNVCNLGVYARERDVVQNAAVCSLELLADRLFNIKLDKSLQKDTDWTIWKEDKEKYAAIDAALSLESREELGKMSDLSRRFTIDDIAPGKTADLVPLNGSVANMATRAATVRILDKVSLEWPEGIVP
ncbi:hypothetical protein ACHAXR_005774, partial [Thalassiosira sp. AJA248-18]